MRIPKRRLTPILLLLLILVGCAIPTVVPTALPDPPTVASTSVPSPAASVPVPSSIPSAAPTPLQDVEGLSEQEVATLDSLEQVDDYPLYTMHYQGGYGRVASWEGRPALPPAWACSLFAALADPDNRLYGRNFDWEYSPALLLFTDPPDGYASVSMVDIAYLVGPDSVGKLTDLPLSQRRSLLQAPSWPFDGMNEHGLVVGMAAVPSSRLPHDPDKETIDSLQVIREMLDHARDVDEAVAVLERYNLHWGGGPALHYLIADASGRAVLVEFYQGDMLLIPNGDPWHQATNFLRSTAGQSAEGSCQRYDRLSQSLGDAEGRLTTDDALDLLSQVAQPGTQWSVVYDMSSGDVHVAMGRGYDAVHVFPRE